MVVGAFAAMAPAPGATSAVGGRDSDSTRAYDGGMVSLLDSQMEGQETLRPEGTLFAGYDPAMSGVIAEDNPVQAAPSQQTESGGRIEVTDVQPAQGTRAPGSVDAGGPYGGPDTYEGTELTFTATVDDPVLIFFRWDIDCDGMWDTGWRLSVTMSDSITIEVNDDLYCDISVEAWDGISMTTEIISGDVMGGWTSFQTYVYPRINGYQFIAKQDLTINSLGWYRASYSLPYRRLILWDFDTQTEVAICTPPNVAFSWNWCSIAPVTLGQGKKYIMGMDKLYEGYPYYIPITSWANIDADTDEYELLCRSMRWIYDGYGMPNYGCYVDYHVLLDFTWMWTKTVLETVSDTAFAEVNNVAPIVYNVQTNPSVAYEGTSTGFTVQFEDPGLDDDWWYKWHWGDGTETDWMPIKKLGGGAAVLILHTHVAGDMDSWLPAFRTQCGAYCYQIDERRYGPYGSPANTAVPYEEMLLYDVVIVSGNYIIPVGTAHAQGDELADYMDTGGNVITMEFSVSTSGGQPTEVGGRFVDDEYTPVEPGPILFTWGGGIGTIYEPGHQLFDGVGSLDGMYKGTYNDVTTGATRIADWNSGQILAAEKENPVVANGAIAFTLNWSPISGAQTGDHQQAVVNTVMYVTGNVMPYKLTQPITTNEAMHMFMDDHPETASPFDDVTVRVQIKDDDHEMLKGGYSDLLEEDFSGYNYPGKPPGWISSPGYGGDSWRIFIDPYLATGPAYRQWYTYMYYQPFAYLWSPSIDTTGAPWVQATLSFTYSWYTLTSYPQYDRFGWLNMSADGGATWTNLLLLEREDGMSGYTPVDFSVDVLWAMGNPDVQLKWTVYRAYMYAYYWWAIDDIKVEAAWGTVKFGLGETSGTVSIINVEPTVHMGPTSGEITESGIFDFNGYKIKDPALWSPTEWFAYKWNFDDGLETDWIYKGSLTPPKLRILFMHSFDSAGTGSYASTVKSMLESLDLVEYVEFWNFVSIQESPSLSYMLDFDVLMWGANYAYVAGWFDALKREMGDNMADYLDLGRGGVLTTMAALDLNNGADYFALMGRYIDDGYAPFEICNEIFSSTQMDVPVHYPDHQMVKDKYVIEDIGSPSGPHTGNCDANPGAIRVASWTDGAAAIGANEIWNGARTGHFGSYPFFATGQVGEFFRNAIAWIFGQGIPTDDIFPVSHQYGDNGIYNVDITLIDDDMGWAWDLGANEPVAVQGYPQTESHYVVPISVDNVDPTLHAMRAYTEVELCIRMTGNKGNMATITLIGSDGTFATATAVRVPGNPAIACLDPMEIEMSMGTTYEVSIFYDPADDDGANPVWTFSAEFPQGKVKELKTEFHSEDGPTTLTIGNKAFKRMAIGAPIDFEAFADDPGSDDLAFVWVWGPEGIGGLGYDIHIYAHPGWLYAETAYANPADLLFLEPDFDKALNDVRSPEFDPIVVTDKATHVFSEDMFGNGPTTPWYVYLLVMDDDVDDDYPSLYGHPGVDMDFLVLDW